MNIQIITAGKGFETQKAIRYFKERRISVQLVELSKKRPLSQGELDSVVRAIGMEQLIDQGSKAYKNLNIDYYGVTSEQTKKLIMQNTDLMKMPLVRNGRKATAGYCPEIWSSWE
ncbi:MAG: ArsC family transcriptional regulator [Clostridiaceae bacterium]|nr:ArsC family transcriptional regulator [Clostridiaceae bacterium]